MTYLGELRINWRFLAAAAVGLGFGWLLNYYVITIMAPHLLREFGWSKAQFSLTGLAIFLNVIALPVVGRLTDLFGVRRVAAVGVIGLPLSCIALSAMQGDFRLFLVLIAVQNLLVGATTTTTVYSRLIAQQFDKTRGLALGISACAPAAAGAIVAPLLNYLVGSYGWRTGYLAVAGLTAIAGGTALLLIPRMPSSENRPERTSHQVATEDYREFIRLPAFRIIFIGIALCSLPLTLQSSQLSLVLIDKGMSTATAAMTISLYAAGVIAGRLICGLALDRLPSHIVATLGFGLPAIGFLVLGSGLAAPIVLVAATFILGLSWGAEGDIMAYLVMHFFRLEIYSTVLGVVCGAIALAGGLGTLLLSATLKLTDSFSPFLLLSAVTVCLGSLLFLLLGRPLIAKTAIPVGLAEHGRIAREKA
jgi:MFS family permease